MLGHRPGQAFVYGGHRKNLVHRAFVVNEDAINKEVCVLLRCPPTSSYAQKFVFAQRSRIEGYI